MNILVAAAHPDDEVLGCGGTIAQHAKRNDIVHILILGEGITARYERPEMAPTNELLSMKEAARQAAKLLGARPPVLHTFPDNRFDTVPFLELVKVIEGVIAEINPSIVYTHSASDLNVDHRLTAKAVLTATRPVLGQTAREIYAFECPSSTEWGICPFTPCMFVPIDIKLKLRALRCYASEMRAFPHPRSYEAIEALAKWRGATAGVKAAEAFEVVRVVTA